MEKMKFNPATHILTQTHLLTLRGTHPLVWAIMVLIPVHASLEGLAETQVFSHSGAYGTGSQSRATLLGSWTWPGATGKQGRGGEGDCLPRTLGRVSRE